MHSSSARVDALQIALHGAKCLPSTPLLAWGPLAVPVARRRGLSPCTGRSRAGRVRHDHLSLLLALGLMVFDHQPIVAPLAHPDPRLHALGHRGVIARRVGAVGLHTEAEVGSEAPRGPIPPAPMEIMLVFLTMPAVVFLTMPAVVFLTMPAVVFPTMPAVVFPTLPAVVFPTMPRGPVGMGRAPDDEDQDHEESRNVLTHTLAPFMGDTCPASPAPRRPRSGSCACHGACRWATDRLQVVWLREALQHCSCSGTHEALCPWYARPSHGITHRLPSLKHILCQTETCPEHATDIVHTEGVREPREAGKPAWGSAIQR